RDFGFWKMRIEDYLYQKKLHEPLSEIKPTGMKQEDWALLDRQALGVVRLSLAKNVAFIVVNEKTTFGLLKALSNMYKKPSASNKVFLIRQLVNTKMTQGATIAGHVNEFNSMISKLLSVDIKFDDEIQALLLLYSLHDSWSDTVRAVSSTSGTNKLTFEEEYCEFWVMDSGASFHVTPCLGIMKNFKPLLRNVRLEDMKVLAVASIRDVVLKTTFGIEWILKNVRYISSLKRKLIFVGQLDNEGYHIGFGDQMWKVTKGSRVIARGCKRGTLYMVEIPVTKWSGENLTEDVDRETERKNAISERLCGRLFRKLGVRVRVKLCHRLHRHIYAPRAELQEKSTKEPLRLDLVTSRKAKIKRWMFKGVKTFSRLNFDEHICVALSEGLLIAGKEDLTCVETLYEWIIGFDKVLVAESNMTKISKLERWDDDVDLLMLLETESRSASKWEIVELWRLILVGANPIPHR
ncbi:hypothetical protein Tco_1413758, partial [Tanacetum coccineum]